jgi:hypothetical protein
MNIVPSEKEKDFALLMAMLATVFEKDGISKQRIEIYYSCLGNIPYPLLTAGVNHIINTRRFSSMPTPAEIREAALGISAEELERLAMDAWGRANRALLQIGGEGRNDPILNEAIKMAFGGWERFGNLDPGDEPWDRLHFLRCYQSLKKTMAETKYLVPVFEPKKLKE